MGETKSPSSTVMRTNIVHIGAEELNYEIRQIVGVAHEVERLSGKAIYWENIGDPVQKGEDIPQWMKDIVSQASQENESYAYSSTQGLTETREFLAQRSNASGKLHLEADDIIFFNGLGDAVNKVYYLLRREARVIGPSPAYPTHSSAEAAHAGYPPITYSLIPEKSWMPDLDDLRLKVKYNESICGIMIINPDNPTGAVFPREIVEEMIAIAREYKLFIVADEIYTNMVYNKLENYAPLSSLIGDVPALSLKGISKEFPWPGARCGWIEVYNRRQDPNFEKYINSILSAKMLEVCSTTLPQKVIPKIMGHPKYALWQKSRNAFFKKRSEQVKEIFKKCPGVLVNPPDGAFYLSIVFKKKITNKMRLKIEDPKVRTRIESLLLKQRETDFSFVYQLLGSKNICVVPLSSFVTDLQGFRCTILEQDDECFLHVYTNLVSAIQEFLGSA